MIDLIKFPKESEGWRDTGEGGLAVFFVLLSRNKRRQKCMAGNVVWPTQDVVVSPNEFVELDEKMTKSGDWIKAAFIDLGMLVASTTKALWNKATEGFFQATEKDLTDQGRVLYDLLTKIYGEKPQIVTLLDT